MKIATKRQRNLIAKDLKENRVYRLKIIPKKVNPVRITKKQLYELIDENESN